ncbi:CYTH and CHAD domain-containing protein [Allonocardiopsis opalescens]|uniref:CHAD domain-containing protein n=1 Tax=Allonocardiopsis opalescens TaxID=1144618 RepID=A0A2T0Q9K0_9ACTN|nr:CYTH and CHAD domain-containing protein [Allonocardiopsis opalescens]PRY00515.1 CHAD domain-containing protein [Allonocardiopsis opalescens]
MSDHQEIETKFEVDAEFNLPGLGDLPGCAAVTLSDVQLLGATYYDAPGLPLAAHGVTLRRRTGGTDEGWHLKLPVSAGVRRELGEPLTPAADGPPRRLLDLAAHRLRGARPEPVATLTTRRSVRRLLDGDGRTLAEIADDSVVGTTGPDAPAVSWREVEVELGTGSAELLAAVGERLLTAGARPAASASKLARVLGDPRPEPDRWPKDSTAAGVVLPALRRHYEKLVTNDPLVRLRGADAVHQMRVSARRSRALLRAYSSLFDPAAARQVADELRWLGRALAPARDAEVMRARIAHRVAALPGPPPGAEALAAELDAELAERERDAYAVADEVLAGDRYRELLDRLDALIADPPLTPRGRAKARPELARAVADSWKRVERAEKRAKRADTQDAADTARHDVRKAAKRARYAADAASGALGKPARRLAKLAKRVQTALGDQQDGVVARDELTAIAGHRADSPNGFALGLLTGTEYVEIERARTHYLEVRRPKRARKLVAKMKR